VEILALYDARDDAEIEGDSAAIAKLDVQISQYLKVHLAAEVDSVRNLLCQLEAEAATHEQEAIHHQKEMAKRNAALARTKEFVLAVMRALNQKKYIGRLHYLRKQANGGINAMEVVQPGLVPEKLCRYTLQLTHAQYLLLQRAAGGGEISDDQRDGLMYIVEDAKSEPDNAAIRAEFDRGVAVAGCRMLPKGEHLRWD
jgi:hypothetical protein